MQGSNDSTHPRLLMTAKDVPALQERAASDPWRGWANRASNQLTTSLPAERCRARSENVIAAASGAALTGVLDDGPSTEKCVQTLLDTIEFYADRIEPVLGYPEDGNRWRTVVPPSGALFSLVIALDVLHPAIPAEELARAENALGAVATWYYDTQDEAWEAARYGAYGTWAAYTGETARLEEAADRAIGAFESEWPDGIYREGIECGNMRFAGHDVRNAKIHFPDVIARTTDRDVYANDAIRRNFAWLFGYSLSPIVDGTKRDCYAFGDSGPSHTITSQSSCAYRAGQFGGTVENNAAWAITGPFTDRNVFTTYVLTDRVPTDPDPPRSALYPGGGAWLLEDATDPGAMAGVLWNPIDADSHSHPDVNALHLCAHGEHVLRNAGFTGWETGYEGFPWAYIHHRAVANNVLLIDYPLAETDPREPPAGGHSARTGTGIAEGMVGGTVEYATGQSGPALPSGTHTRSLLSVHGDHGARYWLVFDDVTAQNAETVHTAFHPQTETEPEPTIPEQEYTAEIDAETRSDGEVCLTVCYGTEPSAVEVRPGALADWDRSVVGQYLYASYGFDESRQLVTALVPHKVGGTPTETERLRSANYSGVRLSHATSESVDRAVTIDGPRAEIEGATIDGQAAVLREHAGELAWGFVRKTTAFSSRDRSFVAGAPVSGWIAEEKLELLVDRPIELRIDWPEGTNVSRTAVDADHWWINREPSDGPIPIEGTALPGGESLTLPAGCHRLSVH